MAEPGCCELLSVPLQKRLWASCRGPPCCYAPSASTAVAGGSSELPKATILPATSQLLLSDLINSGMSSHSTPLSLKARTRGTRPLPRPAVRWMASPQTASSPNLISTRFHLSSRPGILMVSHHQKSSPVLVAFCLHKDNVLVASKAQLSGTPDFP